mmetsp:Transcript_10112/g.40896  ORF Transcript_10112/g.40896 Transcript_10112/m.40896 type:complete len:216 (-) Transcript_10112:615-1262(-)
MIIRPIRGRSCFRNDGYASNPEPRPIASPPRRFRRPSLGHEHVERVPPRTLPHGVGQRRHAPNLGGRYSELHVRFGRRRRSEKQSPSLGSLRGVLRALQGSELALKHRRRAVLSTRTSGVATTSGDPNRTRARHVRQYRPDFHPSLRERRSKRTRGSLRTLRLREYRRDAVNVAEESTLRLHPLRRSRLDRVHLDHRHRKSVFRYQAHAASRASG